MPSKDLHLCQGAAMAVLVPFFLTRLRGGWDASRDRSVREQLSPILQARRYSDVTFWPWLQAPVLKMLLMLYLGPLPLAKVYWKPLCPKMLCHI